MNTQTERVEAALEELKQGKMVILTDDPERENEGDLIVLAEKVTPEIMNFMIRNGSGIVCLPMTAVQLQKLNLTLMVPADENSSVRGTPFTVSIEAKDGTTTGVSASDRVRTIQAAISDNVRPEDIVKPGHVFPLLAKEGGVLERQGHTEGSVDLARLAGFKPAAVLCEIMNADGTMAHGKQLQEFARLHQLACLSIDDIITYRLAKENLISETASAIIPLENYGAFKLTIIQEKFSAAEHILLHKEKNSNQPTLVRIHSACTTGDIFSSLRCDCHKGLHYSLSKISAEGGMLIYLNQEGRGIGLANKIKAYALQEQGYDTVEANEKLGLPADSRKYHVAANILRNYAATKIKLLTNNPRKIADLIKFGINVEREAMPIFHNEYNSSYLKAKKEKLQHDINFNFLP